MAKKRKKQKTRNTSGLEHHKKVGKTLIPPLMALPQMKFQSWTNERMPELLWACLLRSVLPQSVALAMFREIAAEGFKHKDDDTAKKYSALYHSHLRDVPGNMIQKIVSTAKRHPLGYAALRPLLLLETLPHREVWKAELEMEPQEDDWKTLGDAVLKVLDHQSQEATDVRWVSLLYPIALGRMRMPGDILEGIAKYPNHGDQRSVRPSIRAMEMSVTAMSPDGGPAWNEEFWKECLDKTHCTPVLPPSEDEERHDRQDLFKTISEMHATLVDHWFSTLTTTGVDAKHDGSYGFAFYALSLITEMCVSLNSSSISGRLLLRTLAECRITLAYLAAEDDAALWEKYRSYGSGQAKLALLKLEKLGKDVPSHISESVLETLSNEDYFQEYLNIELGSWSGKDLRKMSESSGTKDIYDSYFGWTSNFVHGHWGAQRDCCMAHCLNPLHRLHRVPLPGHRILENALPDGVELVNGILDSLSTLYPGFSDRLSIKPADDDAPE